MKGRGSRADGVAAQEASEADQPVVDAVVPERHPPRRRIDGDNRLAEPAFRLIREPDHRQIRSALHDGVDVGRVDLVDRCAGVQLRPPPLSRRPSGT